MITYSRWNQLDKNSYISLSKSDTVAESLSPAGWRSLRGDIGRDTGKYYFEFKVLSIGNAVTEIGVLTAAASLANGQFIGINEYGWAYKWNGQKLHDWSVAAYGDSYGSDDIIGVALDLDNHKIFFSLNGVWQDSGDPVIGTGYAFDNLSGTVYAAASFYVDDVTIEHFQPGDFIYPTPIGYDKGLWTGTVTDVPETSFDTTLAPTTIVPVDTLLSSTIPPTTNILTTTVPTTIVPTTAAPTTLASTTHIPTTLPSTSIPTSPPTTTIATLAPVFDNLISHKTLVIDLTSRIYKDE